MRPPRWAVALGLIGLGLFLIAGGGAWLALGNRGPTEGNPGREVLWYPTGAAAGCVVNRRYTNCASVPMGNINDRGRVVARAVQLKADAADFRWTVSPAQVDAANARRRAAYIACVSDGQDRCAAPVFLVPSRSSGMAVRWDPSFDAAYPPGVEGSRNIAFVVVLFAMGAIFVVGGTLWVRAGRHGRAA